jgi:hypothetical protein
MRAAGQKQFPAPPHVEQEANFNVAFDGEEDLVVYWNSGRGVILSIAKDLNVNIVKNITVGMLRCEALAPQRDKLGAHFLRELR